MPPRTAAMVPDRGHGTPPGREPVAIGTIVASLRVQLAYGLVAMYVPDEPGAQARRRAAVAQYGAPPPSKATRR